MNKFKIRCKCPMTGEILIDEVEGEKCFEYKGFSFFIRHSYDIWVISDVLCGMKIGTGIDKVELLERAKKNIEGQFEKYITQCKGRNRASWKRQIPIIPIATFEMIVSTKK